MTIEQIKAFLADQKKLNSLDSNLKKIEDWQFFWMNQSINEEDTKAYRSRACGIDANMRHNLAERFSLANNYTNIIECLETALEALVNAENRLKTIEGFTCHNSPSKKSKCHIENGMSIDCVSKALSDIGVKLGSK